MRADTIVTRANAIQNEARKNLATIKIRKDLAQLLRTYCVFNNRKVYDFTEKILEKELHEFKKKLNSIKKPMESKMKEVAKIIIHDGNRVLLQLRDNNPNIAFPLHWNLIGGVIEVSESPQETIKRELQEELGIKLDKIELFAIEDYEETIQHIFSAKAQIDPTKIKLKEGLEIRWFKFSELPSLKIAFNYCEILRKFVGP